MPEWRGLAELGPWLAARREEFARVLVATWERQGPGTLRQMLAYATDTRDEAAMLARLRAALLDGGQVDPRTDKPGAQVDARDRGAVEALLPALARAAVLFKRGRFAVSEPLGVSGVARAEPITRDFARRLSRALGAVLDVADLARRRSVETLLPLGALLVDPSDASGDTYTRFMADVAEMRRRADALAARARGGRGKRYGDRDRRAVAIHVRDLLRAAGVRRATTRDAVVGAVLDPERSSEADPLDVSRLLRRRK